MFAKIAGFELRYRLRNPIFWTAVILFAVLVFYITIGPSSIGAGPGVHKNAPYKVAQLYLMLSIPYMFVSAAFVANAIVRDDQTGFGSIVRATPISKAEYLFGRYIGAFLAVALGFLAIPAGLWLGTMMAWVDPTLFEPNHAAAYLMPYLCFALPNLFVSSAIFFALATMTRSMMATYLSVVALLMLWMAATVASRHGHAMVAAYVDPFGLTAIAHITRYWTPQELNTLATPIYDVVLWNRILWIAVGLAVLAFTYARFSSTERLPRARRRRGVETKHLAESP